MKKTAGGSGFLEAMGMRAGSSRRRLMVIGAHPDDAEWMAGGTAALCRKAGWEVRFTAVTDGSAGHHQMKPGPLRRRRLVEGRRSAARIGASYETLGEPDGRVYVNERSTARVIRAIRRFAPDVLVCHRTCDYHRDHRYSGQLVLDASFVLTVPLVCPDTRAIPMVPVILYACDFFTEGPPFRPDLVVDVTRALPVRTAMQLDHASQYLEWIPWLGGRKEVGVGRPLKNLAEASRLLQRKPREEARRFAGLLRRKYGRRVVAAEAFQVSEYGRRLTPVELARMVPGPR